MDAAADLSSEPISIPRKVRKEIFELLQVDGKHWASHLDDAEFLSRIFDLDALPSTDFRFKTAAGDIFQHTSNNDDWPKDWVLTDTRFNLAGCSDQGFLDFLAETLHPVVRPDREEALRMVALYNEALGVVGWELVEGSTFAGRPRYVGRRLGGAGDAAIGEAKRLAEAMGAGWLHREILRIERAVDSDPDLAIGIAKDLIETCCKTVLHDLDQTPNAGMEFPELVKKALRALKLSRDDVKEDASGAAAAQNLLSNLAAVARYMNELRNLYGTGHGRDGRHRGVSPRHARLAATAAIGFANFLIETHADRRTRLATSRPGTPNS